MNTRQKKFSWEKNFNIYYIKTLFDIKTRLIHKISCMGIQALCRASCAHTWVMLTIVSRPHKCGSGSQMLFVHTNVSRVHKCESSSKMWVVFRNVSHAHKCESCSQMWVVLTNVSRAHKCESSPQVLVKHSNVSHSHFNGCRIHRIKTATLIECRFLNYAEHNAEHNVNLKVKSGIQEFLKNGTR